MLAVLAGLFGLYTVSGILIATGIGDFDAFFVYSVVYAATLGGLYLVAARGVIRARPWSWMVLAGLSAMGIIQRLVVYGPAITTRMSGRFDGLSIEFLFFALFPLLVHGAILTLALLPSVHEACGPPPAVRGPTPPMEAD